MKSLLERFYHGEFFPFAKYKSAVRQYQLDRGRASRSYAAFYKRLPESLKEDFVQLVDEYIALLPSEMEQNYIDGFCTGARMMIEIFASDLDPQD